MSTPQVVEWEEPYGEWLGRTLSLRCTLSLEDAIAAGHIIHSVHGRAVSDAEALAEFLVVNYATVKREK